jgi:uncharacterized protein (TIGR00162 family)
LSYFKSGITSNLLTKIPKLHSPTVVSGFPGTGLVGKIAVDYLIHELKAIHLADIFCTSFPPNVVINPEGIVELNKNSIYYLQNDDTKNDFVFVTGDSQPVNPESEYLLAEEILKIVKKCEPQKIITLGAYITGSFSREPKVFCAATHRETLESLTIKNVVKLGDGTVTGMNGLLLGITKLFDVQGICLLGETSGYVIDAISSKNVLYTLMQLTDLKVEMQNIENRAKDTETLIRTIEQQIANKMATSGDIGQQVAPKRPLDTAGIS